MFLKTDKKNLIILIIVLIVVLSAGFFVFKYLKEIKTTVRNSLGGSNTETQEQADENSKTEENQTPDGVNIGSPQIETEQQPGLFICADKCGDNICQTSDPECKDNMNCVCPETKEDCPSDCK